MLVYLRDGRDREREMTKWKRWGKEQGQGRDRSKDSGKVRIRERVGYRVRDRYKLRERESVTVCLLHFLEGCVFLTKKVKKNTETKTIITCRAKRDIAGKTERRRKTEMETERKRESDGRGRERWGDRQTGWQRVREGRRRVGGRGEGADRPAEAQRNIQRKRSK